MKKTPGQVTDAKRDQKEEERMRRHTEMVNGILKEQGIQDIDPATIRVLVEFVAQREQEDSTFSRRKYA